MRATTHMEWMSWRWINGWTVRHPNPYQHPYPGVSPLTVTKVEGILPSPSGANYRLRLLYKSHLKRATFSAPNARYACLWCVSASSTPREGDATVFPSADALLRHLASHPQPLPSIPGLSVLHGRGAASGRDTREFDLHLPNPATPVPVPDNVARLPRAVALRDHQLHAAGMSGGGGGKKLERPPRYEGEMLEFLAGGIVTGVMFPEKWEGKWCLGRHDGVFGAFAVRFVRVCLPAEGEMPMPGKMVTGGEGEGVRVKGMTVVTRWKWEPSSSEDGKKEGRKGVKDDRGGVRWLSFGKGEVLSDVQCEFHVKFVQRWKLTA